MGLFDGKRKRRTKISDATIEEVAEMIQAKDDTNPYLFLTAVPFGGYDQSPVGIEESLPEELLNRAKEVGGFLSIAAHCVEPDVPEYEEGVMLAFHAHSRIEAAGTVLAFASLDDDIIQASAMQGVAEKVGELELEGGEHSEEHAREVYEFNKSEDGRLVIALPSQDDDGTMEYSGCFISLHAPKRTDSEVARVVGEMSTILQRTQIVQSMVANMHQDISSYGTVTDQIGGT